MVIYGVRFYIATIYIVFATINSLAKDGFPTGPPVSDPNHKSIPTHSCFLGDIDYQIPVVANTSICKQISCSYCASTLVNKKLLKLGFAILPCYIKMDLTPTFSSFPSSSSSSVWTACCPVDLLQHELAITFYELDATFSSTTFIPPDTTRHPVSLF